MNPLKISIPTPCHESWDAMTSDSKGRFCDACAKTVVDFTGMKAPEITDYFLANSGRKVCGRFETSQLMPEPLRIEIPRSILFSRTSFRKMFVLALFISMGTILLSCKNHNDEDVMMGDIAIIDTVTHVKTAPVDLVSTTDTTSQKSIKNNFKNPFTQNPKFGAMLGAVAVDPPPQKLGEVVPQPQSHGHLMGDTILPPTPPPVEEPYTAPTNLIEDIRIKKSKE